MFVFNLILICIAISPAVGAVVTYLASSTPCRGSEFTCLNGSCISAVSVCDGNWDCDDGSDEVSCYSSANLSYLQWQCRDGSCITVDGRCDGKYDCPDKSDETHALCMNNTCQRNWFRCKYGACVDGTAPCNGVVECVDQSDELLSRCQNRSRVHGKFPCLDGNTISASDACDGTPTCPDGSDETVAACAEQPCPVHLFQCAYGACVDGGSDCNGRNDCADGSDESAELCNRMLPSVRPPTGNAPAGTNTASTSGMCLLPPYPDHGTYLVENSPMSKPGEILSSAGLVVTCSKGYGLVGDAKAYCLNGTFSRIPKCERFCKLEPHISVRYECSGSRTCKDYVPPGTRVVPECQPNYYNSNNVLHMTCQANGDWNRIVTCEPECGRVTPSSDSLIFGGNRSLHGEFPWYVAIYRKPNPPKQPSHDQICGGSIISTTVVLSAGHCFWDTFGAQSASLFAVATAKLYRDWDDPRDKDVQRSNILSINFTMHYRGSLANQQDDIAVLILETPFKYYNYVRRVCLHFSSSFNDVQLQEGKMGKVAGFGLSERNATTGSPILKAVTLPYVPMCWKYTPEAYSENLQSDKICAGYSDGTAALCKGDSGGGLVFPEQEHGITRYYLRGIVSSAPQTDDKCNVYTVTTFTSIIKHADFINQFL